jgi:hypothetical protein
MNLKLPWTKKKLTEEATEERVKSVYRQAEAGGPSDSDQDRKVPCQQSVNNLMVMANMQCDGVKSKPMLDKRLMKILLCHTVIQLVPT